MYISYADNFQHNTSYEDHSCVFHCTLSILTVENKTFCLRDGTRIVTRNISFTCKQGWLGKTSQLIVVTAEQVLGALNANDKDLLCEYYYRLFKFLESAQRTILSKENVISRDFGSESYSQLAICHPRLREHFLTLK